MANHGDPFPNAPAPEKPRHKHGSYSRAAHRNRSHEAAHGGEGVSETIHADDHPLVPRGNAPLLTKDAELAELIAHELRIPVVESTGLKGRFDFPLNLRTAWERNANASAPERMSPSDAGKRP